MGEYPFPLLLPQGLLSRPASQSSLASIRSETASPALGAASVAAVTPQAGIYQQLPAFTPPMSPLVPAAAAAVAAAAAAAAGPAGAAERMAEAARLRAICAQHRGATPSAPSPLNPGGTAPAHLPSVSSGKGAMGSVYQPVVPPARPASSAAAPTALGALWASAGGLGNDWAAGLAAGLQLGDGSVHGVSAAASAGVFDVSDEAPTISMEQAFASIGIDDVSTPLPHT